MGLLQHLELDVETGCWNWKGRLREGVRPKTSWKGRVVLVSRLSVMLWRGFDIDSPMLVCHSCDNGRCFNPKHLFIGTHQDNYDDCKSKSRTFAQKRSAEDRQRSRVMRETYQREYQERYRRNHKEYFSDYGQKWRESHPNYWKDYANKGVAQ